MTDEQVFDIFKLDMLPYHMRHGVLNYLSHGIPGGGFLNAVLSNDLVGAYGRADLSNEAHMRVWAEWLYNHAPAGSWGSKEKVKEWMDHHGLDGINERLGTSPSRVVRGEEPLEP
jgi:hypothetical protein